MTKPISEKGVLTVQFNLITELDCWEGYSATAVTDEDEGIHITLASRREYPAVCPRCGKGNLPVHDYRWRKIRELPIFGKPVLLHVERRRLACPVCGTVTERLPWLERRSRITTRLAAAVNKLCFHMAINHVADFFHLDWDTVKAADKRQLQELLERRADEPVRILAMDEFAIQKGHRYATVVINLETGSVLWVGRGRSRESIRPFFEKLGPEICSKIEAVALDCSAAYGNEIKAHCPAARIVYDLFHFVMRYGREVIDRVRVDEANRLRADRAGRQLIKGSRWLLLKNRKNITDERDRIRLKDLLDANRTLAKVYILRDDFKQLWEYRNSDLAFAQYEHWHRCAVRSRIAPLVRFAKNLALWKDGILAHCEFPIHTSVIEGVNNKIKVIKRIAYGFRDDEYFFLKIRASFYHPKTG